MPRMSIDSMKVKRDVLVTIRSEIEKDIAKLTVRITAAEKNTKRPGRTRK